MADAVKMGQEPRETRRSLKLKDCAATARQFIYALYAQSSAASASGGPMLR